METSIPHSVSALTLKRLYDDSVKEELNDSLELLEGSLLPLTKEERSRLVACILDSLKDICLDQDYSLVLEELAMQIIIGFKEN